MKKTIIYLVRHSETIGNVEKRFTGREDYEITENGKKMINLLADRLKNIKIDAIYSSTSNRAIKTVQPIAYQKELEIIKDSNLCEMYFGIYDGWKWEDVNKENPTINEIHLKTNEIKGIPKQETTMEVTNRMYTCIEQIAKNNMGKNILIASHGVAIECFLRKITKEPFVEKIKEYSQKNCSINILEYDHTLKQFNIIKLNDIEHLK